MRILRDQAKPGTAWSRKARRYAIAASDITLISGEVRGIVTAIQLSMETNA